MGTFDRLTKPLDLKYLEGISWVEAPDDRVSC